MITTGKTVHMSIEEAKEALALATIGAVIVYARGAIDYDCASKSNGDTAPLNDLRGLMWQAYKKGQVALFQRRIAENQFEYQARKRKNGAPAKETTIPAGPE
jgi:hypothetical protein